MSSREDTELLEKAIRLAGGSQKAIAELLDVTESTVSGFWKRGLSRYARAVLRVYVAATLHIGDPPVLRAMLLKIRDWWGTPRWRELELLVAWLERGDGGTTPGPTPPSPARPVLPASSTTPKRRARDRRTAAG